MGSGIAVYARLVGAQIHGQVVYRASFLVGLAGTFASTGSELLAVLILFRTFGEMAGWTVGEVALLYGLASIALALGDLVGGSFDTVSDMIRTGQFDRVLTRPVSPFVQVMASEFPLRRLGRIGQGVLALALAQVWLGLVWDAPRVLVFGAAVASSALVFLSVMVVGAAVCFWTTERTEAQNVFTYGGTELASYPMHIYSPWLRAVFLYAVPLALTTYYPALYVLRKPDPLGLPGWLGFVSPFVAGAFFGAALLVWRAGLNHYKSTGS